MSKGAEKGKVPNGRGQEKGGSEQDKGSDDSRSYPFYLLGFHRRRVASKFFDDEKQEFTTGCGLWIGMELGG